MRLKKIAEKMQTALESGKGAKKRKKKIGALVEKLARKKQKFKSRLERTDSPSKKSALNQKLATCETQIAIGRRALSSAARQAIPAEKSARVDEKARPSKKPAPEAEPAADREPPSGPVRH